MHTHIQERISKIQHGEVPEGYQKTKVGIIPEDWSFQKLADIANFTNGKAHENHIDENGKYIVVNSKFVSSEGTVFKRSNENFSPLAPGDIAIVMSDIPNGKALAKCFLVDLDARYTLNQRIGALRAVHVHNVFLFFQLNRNSYFLRFDSGVGQTNLRKSQVLSCPVLLPPLPEQQKIAEILSAWDEAIRLQHELIEQKKTQKRGLMQMLLSGKIRVTEMGTLSPDTIKKRVADIQQDIVPEGYQKTRLGIIPDEWKVTSLNTIANRVVSINDGGQHSVLTISAASGFLNQSERFSKVIAGKNIKKYLLLQKYDFAYNKGNSKTYPQGCVYCLTDYESALVPNIYYCFRIADNSIDYYRHYFLAGRLNQQLKRIINSGVRNDGLLNLNVSDFFKVLVLQPPLEEQKKIADILTTADKEISLLETELAQLHEQKKGLMQLLLSGKIRVHEFQEGETNEIA